MGRVLRVVVMVVALVVGALAPAAAVPPDHVDVIVVLDHGRPARADAADMAGRYGARVEHLYEHVFAGFSASVPAGRVGALARDPRVQRVDQDRVLHAAAETVPTGVRRISAPEAHTAGSLGSGVSVGVLDTGIRTHPDLSIARAAGKDCTGGGTTDDVHGHGTHVAGTVAAVRGNDTGVVGVAPQVTLVPIKVLGDDGSGDWGWIICGLEHAASTGIDVVNLSLSGSGSWNGAPCPGTESLHMAVCSAIAAGTTVVVAAGNDDRNAADKVPAAYPEAITVSAMEDRDGVANTDAGCTGSRGPWRTCEDVLASFSNHGAVIDLMAPGVAITSTTNNGGTGSKSGTSMAAPHVAGVAALVLATHGALTPAEVRDHLRATGQCPDTLGTTSGTCTGAWPEDPDGIPEPLVHASWAVSTNPGGGGGDPVMNQAPTASFAVPTGCVAGQPCTFTDTSTDTDGSVVGWSWDLGNGTTSTQQHASATYASEGSYTVTLTVVDDSGASSAPASATVTVAPSSTSDPWGLAATGEKVKGQKVAHLAWNMAATSASVDVYVDGTRRDAGTANDGGWSSGSLLGKGGGTHTFHVCAAGGTSNCSATVSLAF